MILLVDHQDSFTRNLGHLLAGFDRVRVRDRLEIGEQDCEAASLIVFSPGPGNPDQYLESQDIYRAWRGKKPILGICLGFQLIMQVEGAIITRQSQVLHGVETEIEFDPSSQTYSGLPPSLRVARYHSLRVDPASLANLPDTIRITGRDPIRDAPLSFEDGDRKLFGLQYHPESFLTTFGHALIENIRHACME